MTLPMVQCAFCLHFRQDDMTGNFCAAYPDGAGIPEAIILGRVDHSTPYKGDHGIQFEPLPELAGDPTSGLRPFPTESEETP